MDTSFDSLARRLAAHYTRFAVQDRLLMTGHSHQAWPDVALEGLRDAFDVAARDVDAKWGAAFEAAEVLRDALRTWYSDPDGLYTLSPNTHDLFIRWLSALDLRAKPHVVTTRNEFHSMHRQLVRLEESDVGLCVTRVDGWPLHGFAQRVLDATHDQTAAVAVSRVMFETSAVQQELPELAAGCRARNIPLLFDDYHGTGVVPIDLTASELLDVYVLIGGYKYLQWGEGNCFLRFPPRCTLRPAITGWFASFSTLDQPRSDHEVTAYDEGSGRFSGSTYDPAAQFRAARVARFFQEEGLTSDVIRTHSMAQICCMRTLFERLELPEDVIRCAVELRPEEQGGFLSLRSPYALELCKDLRTRGVLTDARGEYLRFGPGIYTTSSQMKEVFEILHDLCKVYVEGSSHR